MMARQQQIGHWGEQVASTFLEEKGLRVMDRNVRTAYGEIDLVASCQGVLVFVEVKARSNLAFGFPEEAITQKKRNHLLGAIQAYLQAHPEWEGDWRIDVVAIQGHPGDDNLEIKWFENAIA